jgi:hypothetical protein
VLIYCPRNNFLALLSLITLDTLEEPCQFDQNSFFFMITCS